MSTVIPAKRITVPLFCECFSFKEFPVRIAKKKNRNFR